MCDKDTMSYEKCKACEFKIEFSAIGTCGSRWVCKLTGKELMLQHCPKHCQSSQTIETLFGVKIEDIQAILTWLKEHGWNPCTDVNMITKMHIGE